MREIAQRESQVHDEIDRAKSQEHNCRGDLRMMQADLSKAKQDHRNVTQNHGGNKLQPYGGASMGAVLQEIEQSRWRGFKPSGPFGLHIKLRDRAYSTVIESLLNNMVASFGVETAEDERKLQQILEHHRCSKISQIFRCSTRPLHYHDGLPDNDLQTVLNSLDIDNDIVKNQVPLIVASYSSLLSTTTLNQPCWSRTMVTEVSNKTCTDTY
jgi:chromosome segregation ATPase